MQQFSPHLCAVERQMQKRLAVRYGHRATRYYVNTYHDFTQLNPSTVPDHGPAILVCNHISGIDPFVLQATTWRLITWMMAREYYEIPGFKWFCDQIGAIPVERTGKDLASTRAALRVLKEGRVLGIFPEGRIMTDNGAALQPFQAGIGLLALRGGAPIVPVYLEGTARNTEMAESFLYPSRIAVAFGPAFSVSEARADGPERAAELIHNAVLQVGKPHADAFRKVLGI